jgi:hypothetical protein
MLPGIEVLSEQFVSTSFPPLLIAVLGLLLFFGMIMSLILLFDAISNASVGGCITSAIFVITMLVLAGALAYKGANPTGYTEYQVLIDDDVKWKDLYENYEIIDQQGKIYTIKEKTE